MGGSPTPESHEPLRRRDQPLRAGFLELFFDLVYVFALTELSRYLVGHLDWPGAGRTLVLLLPLWWLWALTAWATDTLDPSMTWIQVLIVAAMAGILVMAASIPRVYGSESEIFAGLYVAINLSASISYTGVLRPAGLHRRGVRRGVWFATSAPLWIVGGLVHGLVQPLLWGLAAALEYVVGLLRWPVPGLGRSTLAELRLSGEHASERYRQVFIIALGETVLVSGQAYAQNGFSATRLVALLASFATTALLGRIYIYRAGELLDRAITRSPALWRVATPATHVHLLMIAGVVLTAAADQLLIAHPTGGAQPAWIAAILGGPALFLAGRALFDVTVFARVSWSRLAGLLVLGASVPGMLLLPMVAVSGVIVIVLLGIAVANVASWRTHPRGLAREPEQA